MSKCKKYFSFDVFDTCIVRTCGSPDNIFYLLAQTVCDTNDESTLRAFVFERKRAEMIACQKMGKKAVTIDEIYSCFDLTYFSVDTKDKIMSKEMEIERESFVAVKFMKEIVDKARKEGTVLFITDMYLAESFLRSVLFDLGFVLGDERIYVSGELGLTKKSGDLFNFVRNKEKIEDGRWIHYGDNFQNDYLIPRKKGIKAILVNTSPSKYELDWIDNAKFSDCHMAVRLLSGISRSIRLSCFDQHEGIFVSDIMAPLFVTFVISILKEAVKQGIKRLYFASRDTYVLYRIAKNLTNEFTEIEVRYLYISTKVLYPTYIYDANEDELRHIIQYIGYYTPYKLLNIFGYSPDEIKNVGESVDINREYQAKDKDSTDNIIKMMLYGDYKLLLQKRCKQKRDILIEYLTQEGFVSSDGSKVGLVDIGWRCTSQEMIKKIVPNNVSFLYFGVTDYRVNHKKIGDFTSFTYWDNSYNNKLIEFYMCRSLSGSVLGYEKKGARLCPVLDYVKSQGVDDGINKNIEVAQKTTLLLKQYGILLSNAEELFYHYSYKSLIDFIRLPDIQTVNAMSKELFIDHYNSSFCPIIVRLWPWDILRIIYLWITHNSKAIRYWAIWLDASLVYTYGQFGARIIKMKDKLLTSNVLKRKMYNTLINFGISDNKLLKKLYCKLKA